MEVLSLARLARKLLGAHMQQGGTLAPGTSLRLEVTSLAACLRGQQPESESVTALPPIYVGRSIAGDHEVFEDTDQEFQDVVILGLQWASSSGSASS